MLELICFSCEDIMTASTELDDLGDGSHIDTGCADFDNCPFTPGT